MAPRGPAKAREYDYSNVGKAGRRTGLTLKEGKRDEHGMEEIDGMFSSPEKSPVRENGFGNETMMDSEGMSMDEGNGPGPSDFLNGVSGGRASLFPPPVRSVAHRSPMKTGLTGSPRRTPGLRSSSPQQGPASSSPPGNRSLGSRRTESHQDSSPLTRRSINTPGSNRAQGSRNKTNGDKPSDPDGAVEFSDSGSSQLDGGDNPDTFEQEQDGSVNGFDAGDDDFEADQASPVAETNGQNGFNEDSPVDAPRPASKPTSKTKATSSDKNNGKAASTRNETEQPVQKRKGRGRPPKAARTADDEGDQRPSKKAKTSDQRAQSADEPLDPELEKVVEDYANRTGPLKGRSLHILKRENPGHTRSGRVTVKPLAYWRNERCVYGDGGSEDGARYPSTTVKEVIRTEELEPEKKKAGKRSSKKSKSRKNADKESDDEDEGYVDPWEKEGGVLHGYVRKWDAETQAGTDEDEVLDIAYAPSGIETRDVKDSTFRFAKLLSSSFLGSGIVELPPGGVKKPKNSKKMHMVFYVCHGRVQIDISGVQFSAGKGCVFQVPRGNYYSFANTHETLDARLFFTQGCVPMESDSSGPDSASRATESEQTQTPKPGRRAGTKGRPKGKQNASKTPQS